MKTRLDIIDTSDLLAEIIRKRNEKNITQQNLADFINTSNASISGYENGKRPLTINMAEKIFSRMGYKFQIALTEIK